MRLHMKKIFAAMSAALHMMLPAQGCALQQSEEGTLNIVTTMYVTYDFAKQLTADFEMPVTVKMLLTPGGESHSYEPTPSDVAAIQTCNLFIYNGGTSEKWAAQLIENSRKDKPCLRMFNYVDLLNEETVEGMQAEEDAHEEPDESDEHIWTSPENAIKMADALRIALNNAAPEEASRCDAAASKLTGTLRTLDNEAREIRSTAKTETLIVADRFPFRYFAAAYDWKYCAAFSGCSSDTDASAQTLSFLIAKVKESKTGTVFYLENSTQKIADAVCQATGAKKVMLQSGNNVSAEDFAHNKHYQTILEENLNAIREAVC